MRVAVMRVAESEGWDKRTLHEVGLLLWSLFRYYVIRLKPLKDGERECPKGEVMKIDLGHGHTLEPDEEPRNTPFHKRILRATPLENTRSGNYLELECGHAVTSFGRLEHAAGVVLCVQCRDEAGQ